MKLKHKKLLNKGIVIGILTFFIILFSLLKLNEDVSEYFFARGISRAYVYVASILSDIFPFSVFEVFVAICIIALVICLIFIIRLFVKKQRTQGVSLLLKTIIAILSVALIYVTVASGCYNRKELPLPLYQGEQLTAEETAELVKTYLTDFSAISDRLEYDETGKSICPYSIDELNELIEKEYERLDCFNGYYSKRTPNVKTAVISPIMTYFGICGVTFLPIGEAVVNYETPSCYLVVASFHEIAHAKSVMKERDANLTAYYLLITSENDYLRYCGYMYCLNYLTSTLRILDYDLYKETMEYYPTKASKDRALENDFWASKHTFLDDIGEFFNDLYLKLSGVSDGTANYSDPSNVYIDKEEETITIVYSDTAKMLIEHGLNKK